MKAKLIVLHNLQQQSQVAVELFYHNVCFLTKELCPITFSEYVEDIYQTYLVAQEKNQLEVAMQELSDMNPPPMNTMLARQAREEAIMKRTERKGKTVTDVPPTTPGNFNKL